MSTIRKQNLINHFNHNQNKQKHQTPGPGSYDIALPLIRPNFEAIHKKNDVIIIKVNNNSQSYSFKSQMERFPNQKQRSPGPVKYQQLSLNLRKKQVPNKKYSQRYTDLIQFMYRDRIKISPVPDYKVDYDQQYQNQLKRIKNSHRKYKQKLSLKQQKLTNKNSSINSTNSIINIRSSSKLSILAQQISKNKQGSIEIGQQNKMQTIKSNQSRKQREYRTIDFPEQSSKMIMKRGNFSLQKQQKLILHRATLYNRNMLGMIMATNKDKKRNKRFQSSKITKKLQYQHKFLHDEHEQESRNQKDLKDAETIQINEVQDEIPQKYVSLQLQQHILKNINHQQTRL